MRSALSSFCHGCVYYYCDFCWTHCCGIDVGNVDKMFTIKCDVTIVTVVADVNAVAIVAAMNALFVVVATALICLYLLSHAC